MKTNAIITIVAGEDRVLKLRLRSPTCEDETEPFDLTGVTEIAVRFKKQDGTTLEKTLTGTGVVVTNHVLGKFNVVLGDTETALLKIGTRQSFTVVVDIGTTRRVINFNAVISVLAAAV